MKEDKIKKLTKKYKEGQSDLNEEQVLFNNAERLDSSLEIWSTFVKNNKIETPSNFNDELWESFQSKTNKKRKIFVSVVSVAASIILLISLFTLRSEQQKQNYYEKEALLHLAQNMVSNSATFEVQQHTIYENDMVIIYTTTEH